MRDVLIVGGGLVGTSLALALQPLGLKLSLVEAQAFGQTTPATYDDRSLALAYGSSRIYQGMGLWKSLQSATEAIQHIHVSDRGHFGATRLSAQAEGVAALGYVVESRVLGQSLQAALAGSTLDIIAPARAFALEQHDTHVTLSVESPTGLQQLKSRLLVIADGSQSTLREQLAIPRREYDYGQTALIANVSTEVPHHQTAYERFTPHGPLALLPLSGQRYSLVWTQANENLEAVQQLSDSAFLTALQQAFGYRQGRFLKVGQRAAYPLKLVKASRESVGRAVLIGNASHTLHPVAGQGLNLALRDVAVLCDLIAAARAKQGDYGHPTLLAEYAAARQADYQSVIGYTDSLVHLFSNAIPPLGVARAAALLAVDRIKPLRQLLARQSMGLRFGQARLARGLALQR